MYYQSNNIPIYSDVEQWVYVEGNWGDVVTCFAQALHVHSKFGVIALLCNHQYCDDLESFIQCQPFVQKVITSHDYSPLQIKKETFIHTVCKIYNIKISQIDISRTFNNIIIKVYKDTPKLILPYYIQNRNYGIENWNNVILLHPFSVASTTLGGHWQYWNQFLKYIIETMPYYHYIITGIGLDAHISKQWDKYPHVTNLVNDTNIIKSNCDLFSISNKSLLTITTSNSLAHWCTNQANPSVIFSNIPCTYNPVWKDSLGNEPCIFYPHYTSLAEAIYHIKATHAL